MYVATPALLHELKEYVDFRPEDEAILAEMGPLLRPHFKSIVDDFYDAVEKNPGASAAITGGSLQIKRLKNTMEEWLGGVTGGVYDDAYFEQRAVIGRTHVRINLNQRYMFSAMNILRAGLHGALDKTSWPEEKRRHGHVAIDKICDMELAIMLETYREDYIARMRNAERLATLGQLAASIGHELRNPLAVMETSLHLLRKRMDHDERSAKHIARIGEQVTVSGVIISDLLEMARDRAPDIQSHEIAPLVREAVDQLPSKQDVDVSIEIAPGLDTADFDRGQMRQVLVNLTLNAIQSVTAHGGGHVWVRVVPRGDSVVFHVEDEGTGLSEEVRARLFEPLFTTRAKGIGLGLALCKRIVQKHDGTIRGINRDGGGAIFEVEIPRRAKPKSEGAVP